MSPEARIRTPPLGALTGRFVRYTGGSAVAFATSEIVFVACYATRLVGTTGATIIAFFAGAIPNYVLNRRWVWKRRGPVHVWREVVLYAVVSVVSLVLVAEATSWASHAVDGGHAAQTVAAAAAYLVAYGLLFVAKFIAFETVVFRGLGTASSPRGTRPARPNEGTALRDATGSGADYAAAADDRTGPTQERNIQ